MLHAQTSKHSCLLLLRRRSLVGRLLWSLWCRRAVLLLCGLLRCLRHPVGVPAVTCPADMRVSMHTCAFDCSTP